MEDVKWLLKKWGFPILILLIERRLFYADGLFGSSDFLHGVF